TGLRVVGKGELVYLSGRELTGKPVTSYSWSFLSVPAGSAATLDSVNTRWTTFVPDTTGEFVIRLEIGTPAGTAADTVSIMAAKYVGLGSLARVTPQFPQCDLGCHATKVAQWRKTAHAEIFTLGIDGIASDHYQSRCISCHTVGYDVSPTANNGGFDDVARELGWTFPAATVPGNWDSLVAHYPKLAQLANIQCENCHGPGSLHGGNPKGIDVTLDEGVCGRCHDAPTHHIKSFQWKQSLHAVGVATGATRAECAECHSGYGFVHAVDKDLQYLRQTLGEPRVTCQVCHDPHSDENPDQLRTTEDVVLKNGEVISEGGLGKLCMHCHKSRQDAVTYATVWRSRFGPHHSVQADILAGTNAVTFGMHVPSSNHLKVVENSCVGCHMAPTPAAPSPAKDHVGEHTFAMSWDGGTPDNPADDVDNVAPCQSCHGPIRSFADLKAKQDYDGDGQIESAQDEVKGLLEAVAMLLPPIGSPEVALEVRPTVNPGYTPLQLQAAYNYLMVKEDGSYGIHNYQFAVNLLKVTHAALTTGDIGAGRILSIRDVPNDNGKQVLITWTRFGGDGIGPMPIKKYLIWLRVDLSNGTALAQKGTPVYESLSAFRPEGVKPGQGALVMIDGELWLQAGYAEAAGMEQYTAIAPTLFDSTKTDGMHWSVFRISGHTDIPAIYAMSAPDSGYSVDNLVPSTPTNVAATVTAQGIELTWGKPTDEDFRYFAVYRSTTPGFDPSRLSPIATTTEPRYLDPDVAAGVTYYYRIAAFDFSGNQSQFSSEVSVFVTGVAGQLSGRIPADFVLEQNYPNPFNPSTEIVFGLPRSEDVTLTVYSMQGQAVRTLVRGRMAAGYHRVTWDGRSDQGETLAAGTYIYRLQAGDLQITKKMVFLK
ncbi:MAG: T9SS type A sorting domain-containing protein, partial [candidate division KSB1 bacterium]|nr:T9SS type A sorting domain-containing protein [candidate division KSB1 bacterium]